MSRYIPETDRQTIKVRASFSCEYCLIHEEDSFFSFEIDHIISIKHGGKTEVDNLAYACLYCNRNKGSDIGSVLLPEMEFVRLFHPRLDRWNHHFEIDGPQIVAKTSIAKATEKILELNHINRLLERRILVEIGRFPPEKG